MCTVVDGPEIYIRMRDTFAYIWHPYPNPIFDIIHTVHTHPYPHMVEVDLLSWRKEIVRSRGSTKK